VSLKENILSPVLLQAPPFRNTLPLLCLGSWIAL
jgi:hypothetical protein